jgi:hypothetical protein
VRNRALLGWGVLAAISLWSVVLVGAAGDTLGCPRGQAGSPWALLGYSAAGGVLQGPSPSPAATPPWAGRPLQIVIEAPRRRLYLFAGDELVRSFPVAVGTAATPTPIGHWRIKAKAIWGGAFGARWLQLSIPWGTYGIHGTNNPGSIGSRASHGCVRMFNRDVVQLYDLVPLGTPVTIRGRAVARFGEVRRVIVPTLLGSDVVALQQRLQALGEDVGPITGVYGGKTVAAVKEFQRQHGLAPTGVVDAATYDALGLVPQADDPTLRPTPPGEPVVPPPPGTPVFPPSRLKAPEPAVAPP